jgi:dsDNA-specific endonuclease/ATPase MutS2
MIASDGMIERPLLIILPLPTIETQVLFLRLFFTFQKVLIQWRLIVSSKKEYDTGLPPIDELRLRHLTVDEALPELDRFLHDAYLSGLLQVRVIHGKGTGMLRETVRRVLGKHPLVKSFRAGDKWEGGEGVTIVEFTEK